MTAELKATIVAELARCFAPTSTAHAVGISYECYRQHYHGDPDFRAAVEDARRTYADSLRMEVHRRAIVGWTVPVFHRGKKVGSVRRYSDRLLLRHIAAFDPSYRSASVVDQTTRTDDRVASTRAVITHLPAELQTSLRALARSALARRSLAGPPDARAVAGDLRANGRTPDATLPP